jgi:hypothetical protein
LLLLILVVLLFLVSGAEAAVVELRRVVAVVGVVVFPRRLRHLRLIAALCLWSGELLNTNTSKNTTSKNTNTPITLATATSSIAPTIVVVFVFKAAIGYVFLIAAVGSTGSTYSAFCTKIMPTGGSSSRLVGGLSSRHFSAPARTEQWIVEFCCRRGQNRNILETEAHLWKQN